MARTINCEHFTGIGMDTCRAGVRYDDVMLEKGTPQASIPCIIGSRKDYNPLGAKCDKCKMPTPEEMAAEEREMHESMERMMKARAAIVAHCGGPWKRGMSGSQGRINCPVCGATSALAFTRSGYNGHIHAACSTDGCCSWME